ncbi:nuclear transport factor 2 family protein [Candidatus Laterigemmans baculatus]|uniref:nuclear transport factor 2 family protein n=1 Tax=Candidatus Laterigemmans baculatus TaxID=2770505 RepID=UPI0013D90923|nr:nuclear transport factor 2 family protein [Candidatus Laterigemmans baculatus]
MTAVATELTAPTATEAEALAADWYRKLDIHAPLDEVLALLSGDDVEMQFPEATLRGTGEFQQWYERVTNLFFDEVHTLKQVDAEPTDNGTTVKVVVRWEASVWNPPAANSERIKCDAYQTWHVTRAAGSGRAVISRYIVDELVFDADSAKL